MLGTSLALYGCGGSSPDETASSTPTLVLPIVSRLALDRVVAFSSDGSVEARDQSLTRLDANGAQRWSVSGPDRPVAVALGQDGRVYVLERNQLRLFSADGQPLGTRGSFGYAQDVAVGPDRVYVSEMVGRQVSVLDLDGQPSSLIRDPLLDFPRGLALNNAGELHVVSAGQGQVLIFGPEGGLRGSYGQGRLISPRGVDVRKSDQMIAVSDLGGQAVQLFSGALQTLGSVPQQESALVKFDPDGNLVLASITNVITTTGALLPFASVFQVKSFARPKGQTESVSDYPELFSVIGQQFGGGDGGIFRLPDLAPLGTMTGATVDLIQCLTGQPPGALPGIVGECRLWPGLQLPPNWLACDGSVLAIEQHPDLASILGTRFGGDGVTTFGLPQLFFPVPGVVFMICADGILNPNAFPEDYYLGTFTLYAGGQPMQYFREIDQESVLLKIDENRRLFSLLSTTYGGDGQTTFALPFLGAVTNNVRWMMPLSGAPPPT